MQLNVAVARLHCNNTPQSMEIKVAVKEGYSIPRLYTQGHQRVGQTITSPEEFLIREPQALANHPDFAAEEACRASFETSRGSAFIRYLESPRYF